MELKYTVESDHIMPEDLLNCGRNVLAGRKPEILDANGHTVAPFWDGNAEIITKAYIVQHIDIGGEMPVTITYDFEQILSIEQVAVAAAHAFHIADYEIFVSSFRDNLYDKQNRVAVHKDTSSERPTYSFERAIQKFVFKEFPRGRYFGIKVNIPNSRDNLIRPLHIAVYSKEFELQRTAVAKYGDNILEGSTPYVTDAVTDNVVWPYFGEWKYLTDNVVFDSKTSVCLKSAKGKFRLVYTLRDSAYVQKIAAVVENADQIDLKIYVSDNEESAFDGINFFTPTLNEDKVFVFEFDCEQRVKCIAFELDTKDDSDSIVLHQLGVYSNVKQLTVDFNKVLNSDFWGNGVNLVPFTLCEAQREIGYSPAHWEVEKKRIINIKPRFVRIWVQVDWIEKKKGVFNFNTQQMDALCQFLDVFKLIGTEVQITYGWKVGKEIYDWYCFPDLKALENSAPKDPEAYAVSCSTLFKELWHRGYDNVRHVAIANEPNGWWDFDCPGDQRAYFVKVLKALDKQFKLDGIRDRIKIWGPESAADMHWVEYCVNHAKDVIDLYSYHDYTISTEDFGKLVHRAIEMGAAPFMLTEFAEDRFRDNTWGMGYAGHTIVGANAGYKGLLNWSLHCVKCMSTDNSKCGGMNDYMHLWDAMLNGGTPHPTFYIFSLLMRYIEPHCKVVKIHNTNSDIRAAAFVTDNGDVTVITEFNDSSQERQLILNLGKEFNKPLYKHSYCPSELVIENNAIIPPVETVLSNQNAYRDRSVNGKYSVAVYTTLSPQPQIAITPAVADIGKNGSIKFTAENIDAKGDIVWSILYGGGTVSKDGTYKADDVSGTVAVKAQNLLDPSTYSVALINVK